MKLTTCSIVPTLRINGAIPPPVYASIMCTWTTLILLYCNIRFLNIREHDKIMQGMGILVSKSRLAVQFDALLPLFYKLGWIL
jgi:hypothetical protein